MPNTNTVRKPHLLVRRQAQPLADDMRVIDAPALIIEVLSPSTEAIDRREGDIGWRYLPFTDDKTVEFASLGLTPPMNSIYA